MSARAAATTRGCCSRISPGSTKLADEAKRMVPAPMPHGSTSCSPCIAGEEPPGLLADRRRPAARSTASGLAAAGGRRSAHVRELDRAWADRAEGLDATRSDDDGRYAAYARAERASRTSTRRAPRPRTNGTAGSPTPATRSTPRAGRAAAPPAPGLPGNPLPPALAAALPCAKDPPLSFARTASQASTPALALSLSQGALAGPVRAWPGGDRAHGRGSLRRSAIDVHCGAA